MIEKSKTIKVEGVGKHDNASGDSKFAEVVRQTLNAGQHLIAGGGSAWIGTFATDPLTTFGTGVAGAALSQVMHLTTAEIGSRLLGNRQRARVGAAAIIARDRIKERLEHGDQLRADKFFIEDPSDRSTASEIFEAVLLAAQNEHQEKKIEAIGRLFANIAFDPTVDRESANLFVKISERLSYRQMCFLVALHNAYTENRGLTGERQKIDPDQRSSIHYELFELNAIGLLDMPAEERMYAEHAINLMFVSVTGIAKKLISLMELERLDRADLADAEILIKKTQSYDF